MFSQPTIKKTKKTTTTIKRFVLFLQEIIVKFRRNEDILDTVFREFLEQQNKCSRNKELLLLLYSIWVCVCVCSNKEIEMILWLISCSNLRGKFQVVVGTVKCKNISNIFFPFFLVDDAEADGNAAWYAFCCCFNTGYLLKYATEYGNKIK